MLNFPDRETNYHRWLLVRRQYLGASEAPAACGIDSHKTPLLLANEKWGTVDAEPTGEAARWGQLLEPIIIEEVGRRLETKPQANQQTFQHDSIPFLIATPDAFIEIDGVVVPLQVKTTNQFLADRWEEGPSDTAHCQVMHEMAVLNSPFVLVACLIGGQLLKIFTVERDEALIKQITDLEIAFWRHVENRTEPPVYAADNKHLNRIRPVADINQVYLPDLQPFIDARAEAIAKGKEADEQRDLAEANIKQIMGNLSDATTQTHAVKWMHHVIKGKPQRKLTIKEIQHG